MSINDMETQDSLVNALTSFVAPYGQRVYLMSDEERIQAPTHILQDILLASDSEEDAERAFRAVSGLLVIGLRVMWRNVVDSRQRLSV